jgi:hypothetical protein
MIGRSASALVTSNAMPKSASSSSHRGAPKRAGWIVCRAHATRPASEISVPLGRRIESWTFSPGGSACGARTRRPLSPISVQMARSQRGRPSGVLNSIAPWKRSRSSNRPPHPTRRNPERIFEPPRSSYRLHRFGSCQSLRSNKMRGKRGGAAEGFNGHSTHRTLHTAGGSSRPACEPSMHKAERKVSVAPLCREGFACLGAQG